MTRGFLLGKFMPPHAGHMLLCETASRLVDELTVLVCWLPDDPIAGPLRLEWMQRLLPGCRVIGHGAAVPQQPDDDPDFWPVWRRIVRDVHPQPIDLLFAGEEYGRRLAEEVGGLFVPLGARCMAADPDGMGGVSASAIRADPWRHWRWLPEPVRAYYAGTICLHGPESTGKSVLSERLAKHFGTIWVPEYGRAHCETYGTDLDEADLLLIGKAQAAMTAASLGWCDRRLIVDTDPLMTAAWCQMMLGRMPEELFRFPKADLYLMMEGDVGWQDDGTRVYGGDDERARFNSICRDVLDRAGVSWISVSGPWDSRFAQAAEAVERLVVPPNAHPALILSS